MTFHRGSRKGLRRLACALVAAWLAAPGAWAQADSTRARREVEFIYADSLAGETVGGERVERLVGNVALRQDSTLLWADRVVRYLDRNEIHFTGNVRIVDRGDTLWAPVVLYDRATKVGRASGGVRLSDGEVVVTAPTGLYFTEEKRASFDEGVTLVDSATVLRSRAGVYWTDEKRAEFAGDVSLDESRTHLEADSVSYLRETEVSVARGGVFIERLGDAEDEDGAGAAPADSASAAPADTTTRTLLFGEHAYNDNRAGFSRITGQPLLVQLRRESAGAAPTGPPADTPALDPLVAVPADTLAPARADTLVRPLAGQADVDTLLIRAVVLEVSRVDSLRRLTAIDSVRIWQRELAAVADSLVFDRVQVEGEQAREEARLFGSPVAWFETSQVSGDTLRIKGRDGAVDTLFVYENTFVAQRDTVLERIHQLRGRHLVARFRDDTLRTLTIGPNAEAIRFLAGEQDEPDGAFQGSADRITFGFERGELRQLTATSGIEGTIYGEDQLPQPLQLEGYRWLPERRPAPGALLGGRVLPAEPPGGPRDEPSPAADPPR